MLLFFIVNESIPTVFFFFYRHPIKVACKKYEAAIQMLQEMNDRHNSTLAKIGLVKSLLLLDNQKSMVNVTI